MWGPEANEGCTASGHVAHVLSKLSHREALRSTQHKLGAQKDPPGGREGGAAGTRSGETHPFSPQGPLSHTPLPLLPSPAQDGVKWEPAFLLRVHSESPWVQWDGSSRRQGDGAALGRDRLLSPAASQGQTGTLGSLSGLTGYAFFPQHVLFLATF